jgi:uncharacterized protein
MVSLKKDGDHMGQDHIRYDILAQDALRGVIRKVLAEVAATGHLPGDHHFFITFLTGAPGVRISQHLKAKYPEQMTIVVQHQFWELKVTETGFEIGLSFSDTPEKLVIPFNAVRGFYDPSVNFELEFDVAAGEQEEVETAEITAYPVSEAEDDAASQPRAEAPPSSRSIPSARRTEPRGTRENGRRRRQSASVSQAPGPLRQGEAGRTESNFLRPHQSGEILDESLERKGIARARPGPVGAWPAAESGHT